MNGINWQIAGIFFSSITLFGIAVDIYLLYLLFSNVALKRSYELKKEKALLFSLLIAFTATLGSLFFSEIAKYEPCKLCWYQRILMYPLVIIFFVALKNRQTLIFKYTRPMTFIGTIIALYHYLLQMAPSLFSNSVFCNGVSCAMFYMIELGFITIPFMALIAFLGLSLISLLVSKK